LENLGYKTGGVDGIYGEKTKAAVLQYQKDNGLLADGIIGNQTLTALKTNVAVQNAPEYVQQTAMASAVKAQVGEIKDDTILMSSTTFSKTLDEISALREATGGTVKAEVVNNQVKVTGVEFTSTATEKKSTPTAPSVAPQKPSQAPKTSENQGTGNAVANNSPFTYDLSPDINIEGNRAYMFKGGIEGENDYAGGSINAYVLTGTAETKALFGWESNQNGTKVKGGKDEQIMGVDLRATAGISATNANADGFVGYKDYVGLTGEAEGSVGKAQAYAAFTARIDGEQSVGLRLGAEAAVFDGQIGGGFYLFGYEVKVGLEGSAIAAGAKAELGVFDGRLKGRAKAALGLGGGIWFDIGKRK